MTLCQMIAPIVTLCQMIAPNSDLVSDPCHGHYAPLPHWAAAAQRESRPWPEPRISGSGKCWCDECLGDLSVSEMWNFSIFSQAFHVMILKDVRKVFFHQDYETFSRLMEFMTCLHEAFPHVKCICGWRGKCFKLLWKYCFSHWESLCS